MKKTLLLALALTSVSLAGCADETPEEVDTTIVTPVEPAAPAADPMMADTTGMMADPAMEGGAMADTAGTMGAAPAAPMMSDSTGM